MSSVISPCISLLLSLYISLVRDVCMPLFMYCCFARSFFLYVYMYSVSVSLFRYECISFSMYVFMSFLLS